MLMGFEAPSGGCVSVDGEPLAGKVKELILK